MNRFALVTKRTIIVVGLALTSLAAFADEPKEAGLRIAPQPLSTALREFSEQTGLQVGYASELAEGKSTDGVEGIDDPDLALDTLLAKSRLTHTFVNEQTVVIHPAEVAVSDDAGGDSDSGNWAAAGATPIGMAQNQTGVQQSHASQANERESEREKRPIEEIVVTGTNIRGLDVVASPLTVIDKEAIDRAGFANAQQIVQSIPANFNGGSSEFTVGGLTSGGRDLDNSSEGTGANLRGLGNDSTLVLLNGRRIVASNQGNYVDLSLIPTSAIDRVEVLSDGGSAIYGSDAVGGVINFVLREGYDGAESTIRGGYATPGGAEHYGLSQTIGKTWGSGDALLSYEFYHRNKLKARDRTFSEDIAQPFDLLPRQKRHGVFFTATQHLGDRTEVSGNATYSKRSAQSLRNISGGALLQDRMSQVEQFSISFGGWHQLGDNWFADVYGSYGQSETQNTQLSNGAISVNHEFMPKLYTAEFKLDGDLFDVSGGAVKVAMGTQYRREEFFSTNAVRNTQANFDRNILAAFGELYVPIISDENASPGFQKLGVTSAIRYEHYSNFGSTTDPKFGAVWSPIEGLNFRGTWGTSFRAPLFVELDEIGNQSAAISPIAFPFFSEAPSSFTGLVFTTGNNAKLGPETAAIWTAGLDATDLLIDGLTVSATYFDVRFENRIGTAFSQVGLFDIFEFADAVGPLLSSVTDPAQQQALFSMIDLSFGLTGPDEISHFFEGRTQNLAITKEEGVDLGLLYSRSTRIGDFNFSFNGTYITTYKEKFSPTAPDSSNFLNTLSNPIDWRMRTGIAWSDNTYSVSGFINYTNSYRNTQGTLDEKVDSWTTFDLTASVNVGKMPKKDGILQGLVLRAVGRNLFNQNPPHADIGPLNPIGFDGANANPLGRVISLELVKEW